MMVVVASNFLKRAGGGRNEEKRGKGWRENSTCWYLSLEFPIKALPQATSLYPLL
jgi:hypothetical protein